MLPLHPLQHALQIFTDASKEGWGTLQGEPGPFQKGDEVGLSVCPSVENPVLLHQETGNSRSMTHPRLAERDSRQAIQTWPDHSN